MTTTPVTAPSPRGPVTTDAGFAQTTAFFDALYSDVPDDLHTLLWTVQGKRSSWVPLADGPAPIATRARSLADGGRDVYCAVTASTVAGMPDTRIAAAQSAGLFGLWADIDIADPDAHKKWNLPPSQDAAMELLDAAGLEPTLIVHSGHGLQAWWLFNEFWRFDSEAIRLEAAGLAQRWNTTLQVRAAERSWVVDSTFDLARVMRVPGTLNRKADPVVPVRLLVADGPRYEPDRFDDFAVDSAYLASRGLSPARSYVPDEFEVSEGNKVDFEALQALVDNDDTFKATWDNKRKDFTDQSPSSYDLSLATQAARASWSDSQIAALILAFRRRHKMDTAKALRKDYIDRTLARARDGLARDEATEALEEVGEALATAKASGDDEQVRDARRDGCDVLSQQLTVEILHIIRYLADPPLFAVVTPTATIAVGGADGILTWSKLRQSIWESVGVQIPRFKPAEWDRITAVIPRLWEDQDIGAEATERGEVASWLSTYLGQRPPVDDLDDAVASEYPFKGSDGRVMLFGPAFKRWLWLTYQERVSNKDLGRRLRAFGCEPDRVNVTDAGKRTSKGVWRLPAGAGGGVA
jgi:hypothetical protein